MPAVLFVGGMLCGVIALALVCIFMVDRQP
jgi:hypothetical protein